MLSTSIHERQRPIRLPPDEAFFFVGGDRLAVRTRGVHPRNVSSILAPRAITSGTACVAAPTAPDRQPRDWAPEYPTVANIAASAAFRHRAPSLNTSDWARHEYPIF